MTFVAADARVIVAIFTFRIFLVIRKYCGRGGEQKTGEEQSAEYG
jgi:hypothetical protein